MKKIIIVLIVIFMTSCEQDMEKLNHLKKGKKVQLLYLDAIERDKTIEGEKYIKNRKVLKKFELNDAEKESLIKTLIKKNNYEPLTRKCKFEPVYALNIDNVTVAVFDVEYCPSLEYYENDGSKHILQLKSDSPLKTKLKSFIK